MSDPNGSRPQLRVDEWVDHDGVVRFALAGELDHGVADVLDDRLVALKRDGCRVRLYLAARERG